MKKSRINLFKPRMLFLSLTLAASIAGVPDAPAASWTMLVPWGNPPVELHPNMAKHVQGGISIPSYWGAGSSHWSTMELEEQSQVGSFFCVPAGVMQHDSGWQFDTLRTVLHSIDEDGSLPDNLIYNTGPEHLDNGYWVSYFDSINDYVNSPNEIKHSIPKRFRSDVGNSTGVPKNYLRSARQYSTWMYPRAYENKITVGEAWKSYFHDTHFEDPYSGASSTTLTIGYEYFDDSEINGVSLGNLDMFKVTRTNTFRALHGDYEIRSEKTYNHNHMFTATLSVAPPDNWGDGHLQWWEGTNLTAEVISDFELQGNPEARWGDQYEEIIRVKNLYDTSPVIQVRMMPHVGILFASATNYYGPDSTRPMIVNIAPYWAPFTFPILGSNYHDIVKTVDAAGNPVNPTITRAQHSIIKSTQTKSKNYDWTTLNGQVTIDPSNHDSDALIVVAGGPTQSNPTTRELLGRQVVWHGNYAPLLPAGEAGKERTSLSELGLVVAPGAPNPEYWLVTFEVTEHTGITDDPSLLSLHVKVGNAITAPVPVIRQ